MKNLKEIIIELREIWDEKDLSYDKLLKMMENNGDYLSKSTLSRLFGKNWEKYTYNYESTIRPIAKVLLGIETIEETDDTDTKAMKTLLKYKIQRIEELESQIEQMELQIEREKDKYHTKLADEASKFQRSIEFTKKQIELKDKRIDQLMDANDRLSITNNKLLNQFLNCPLKREKECSNED